MRKKDFFGPVSCQFLRRKCFCFIRSSIPLDKQKKRQPMQLIASIFRADFQVRWEFSSMQKLCSRAPISSPPEKVPGCGWSRAYLYKSNPHRRGWVLYNFVNTIYGGDSCSAIQTLFLKLC